MTNLLIVATTKVRGVIIATSNYYLVLQAGFMGPWANEKIGFPNYFKLWLKN